ncbi:MAG: hypothetical protein J0G30_01780 [Actinomycetales bacterium]|nr:hypothetical protein [Actinomycetales bacterium]
MSALPQGWSLAASAFNWTPEVIRAERSPERIAVDIVAEGIARVIEIEPGQTWRGFPEPSAAEARALRERLEAVGGRVSILGGSIDEFRPDDSRRDDAARLAFLLPQLRAAAQVGAQGLRLPIGQAGEPLLRALIPHLEELDLVLFEEAQGHQTPDAAAADFERIATIDHPRVRLLVDISMLMPALPVSYLETLERGGLDAALVTRLRDEWADPATQGAVFEALRSGAVPGPIHTLFMDLVVRFGRSPAAVLRPVLPLVGAFHLKFWDLDDADGRVSAPIRELAAELRDSAFTGTLCSEWGGHEWLDDDPAAMTRAHLELARNALAS